MRLSKTYADFNSEITVVVPYATANALRLGIPDVQVTALAVAKAAWDAQYKRYMNPEIHGQHQVETTRNLYKEARTLLNDIQQQVKNSKYITLTDADIDSLYIHRNAPRRGRIPVPSVAPDNVLLESKHLTNRIGAFEPNRGAGKRSGLPVDVKQVGRKIAVVAHGEPIPEANDYHAISSSGSGMFDLIWQPEQANHICHLITWFVNYRGEEGPESLPFAFTII